MVDCFWTDFVACAEDCGGSEPPATGPAVLLGLGAAMGAGGSGSGDAIPYLPLTGERIAGVLEFATVDVYKAVDSGCSWVGFIATTDPALAGTAIADAYDAGGNSGYSLTWKLVSDFSKSFMASGTNIALNAATDGLGGSTINTSDLLTEIGASGYDNSGLLIVATLRNVTSGDTWEATWALDTCF